MSSGAQKLLADYEQIQKLLDQYPTIKLVETEGDPPERYDIEYTVKGYKTNIDGTPVPASAHQVSITLPFGYPHFPPTAKPLSPIFHPDIDPDAIRIADFWQDNKSLADLILHIGEMICGIHVNKGEPFNQKAADWYEERKSWLPFDTMDADDGEELDDVKIDVPDIQEETISVTEPKVKAEPRSRSGKPLDILKEDFDFPFDEDELLADVGSFDTVNDKLTGDDSSPDKDDDDISLPEDIQEESPFEIDLTEDSEDEDDDDDISLPEDTQEESPFEIDLTEDSEDEDDEDALDIFDLDEGPEEIKDLDALDALDEESVDLTDTDTEDASLEFSLDEETSPDTPEAVGEIAEPGSDDASSDFDLGMETETEESKEDSDEFDLDSMLSGDEFSGLDDDSLEGLDLSDEEITGQEDLPKDDISLSSEDAAFTGLDDDSLDGLDLSEEEPPEMPEVHELEEEPGGESRAIQPLIDKREIFTAKRILAEVQDTSTISNLKEIEQTITEAISEAEELYKKADALEQKGELEKAGLMLDLVANIATDYPGLEFARNRIRESMMSGEGKKEDGDETEDGATTAKKKKSPKIRLKIPYKLIASILLFLGIAGGGTIIYMRDSENIEKAFTSFQQAEKQLEQKEFKSADKALKTSQEALANILILEKDEKEKLQKKIDAISSSEMFKEGLKGRVLYGDKYVTVEMAKNIDSFVSLRKSAEVQQNSAKTDKAIALYEKAIPLAEKIGFTEEAQTIKQTIYNLRLNQTLAQARKAEDENEWKQAADTYAQALKLSENLSSGDDKNEISTRLASASFRHELDLSKRAFTASEWQKTIEMLQRALNILEDNPEIASEQEKAELNKLLVNSRLYHMLSGAKKAFEKNEWELAVNEYKNAIYLLENNTAILGEDVTDSVNKINKTILMTEISREQEMSTDSLAQNNLEATREHYLAIASLIEDSKFKDEEMFTKILENARTQSDSLEKEIVINRRIDWLVENYEKIFRENYPSAEHSELSKPNATFIKKEDRKLIFTMSCVEKKQGRKFRLELNYQFDQDTDKWSIYSGKL